MSRLRQVVLAVLVLIAVLCYSQVTTAEARNAVTVSDLRYSPTIQYGTSAQVGATLSYQETLPGYYLAMGVVDMDTFESLRKSWHGNIAQTWGWMQVYPRALLSGDATANPPLNCGEGERPLLYAGFAFCSTQLREKYHLPPSGSWDVEFTLTNLTPGTRRLGVVGMLYVAESESIGSFYETPPVAGDVRSFDITVVTTTPTTSTVSTTSSLSTATGSISTTVATSTQSEVQITSSSLTTSSSVQPGWGPSSVAMILVPAILAAAVAVGLISRRKKPMPAKIFCVECGAENPTTNEFCGKCGQKLKQ